ncbi:Mesoderm development candidate [Parasponia andersonii]|uniref:Mesoderm development candidate n=1 Tax=Parasponia andersonii TaxID=3476 RepID=A0A2P5D490_PARAD|nr:Mesoderm development candidate [Parasponia andersonii]
MTTSFSSHIPILLVLLLTSSLIFAEGKIHITDDLDDVVDDEEDESWKEWGKKSAPSSHDDDLNPSDLNKMDVSQIQAEIAKHQSGPVFGFVKLRLGVKRTRETVTETAMQWTKVLKTGAVEAKFMGVDLSTIMFTMERGQDVSELKEFVFDQPEAYEVKIGDQVFRRPGDPPLEEVVEELQKKTSPSSKSDGISKDEL